MWVVEGIGTPLVSSSHWQRFEREDEYVIKATGRSADGTPVLVLGLSGENVARLMAKDPILVSKETMAEMGFPSMHVVIVGGRTEEAIAEELAEHVARLP